MFVYVVILSYQKVKAGQKIERESKAKANATRIMVHESTDSEKVSDTFCYFSPFVMPFVGSLNI